MTAQKPDDAIMRDSIVDSMRKAKARRSYQEVPPWRVLDVGIDTSADACARHLFAGRRGLAYAAARIHAELLASQARMFARHSATPEP
jgi:hypothetical protein